ncbi:MAG: MFS transporter, partial [Chloroflexota bacterium]
WLVYDMTGSGGMVGAIFAMRSAPNLLVGFAAGSITDRLDRRTLLRLSAFGTALVPLAVALLLFTGQLTVWQLMLATFFMGTLQAFYLTARQVYVYDVVGASGAMQGIALIFLAQRAGEAVGALLAGGLIHWWGPGPSFLAMSLTVGAGALALYGLRHRGQSAPLSRESMGQNLLNYLRALKTNRVMGSLMVTTAVAEILGFSHQVVLPIMAQEVFHVGAAGLGVLTAFRSVGGALGVLALATLGKVRRRGLLLLVVLALFGGGQMLLAQATDFWLAALFVTLINVMASATDTLHQTLIQLSVPNEQRGRAMGSWMVGIGTGPLGQLEVGHLAGLTSARVALLVNGATLAGLALVLGMVLRRLRRL